MPKSQPLVYAQIPFFLNKMGTTEEITETIREIRTLCEKFEEKGLPNFPTGLPFIYWEQYLGLRNYLWFALICIFVAIFLVISILLVNCWAAAVVIFLLAVILIELFGFMGIMGIKLSAVPAVILIAAIGVGVEFGAHLMMGFLTSIGSRERRMVMTLEQMFCPVVHGAISTLIGVIMLAFSEFDFIFRYFFIVLSALVILGLLNGFILFPVVLSVVGPPGEVRPRDNPDRIATPSPEASPIRQRIRHARPFSSRRMYPRIPSDFSLSTIAEESSSCHSSHEIVVQPEVIVETTTVTNTSNGATTVNTTTNSPELASDSQSEDCSKCNTPNGENVSTTTTTNTSQTPGTTHTAVTTRVTATAKVKVEVHGPTISSSESSRSRRKRDSCSSCSSSARSSPT